MPSKRIMRFLRFLTAYSIVVGGAVLLAPETPRAWASSAGGSQTTLATYA
jgi:hypothetical protein